MALGYLRFLLLSVIASLNINGGYCRERVTRKRGLPACGDCAGRGTLCGFCVKLIRCPSLYLVQYLCQSNCVYCSINIHYCVTLNIIVKVIQSAAQCYYCSNYLKLRKVFVINYMVHRLVTGPEPPYCAQRD